MDQAPAQDPANFFLVILPQRRQLPAVLRHRDLDPFADDDDSFSIDFDNDAVLREKQVCSVVLDRVSEFCGLAWANAESKKGVMACRDLFTMARRKERSS